MEFEKINQVIKQELKDLEIEIEHVGSTAVPGLFAKPIIDIDIIIKNKDLLKEVTVRLNRIGYIAKGEQGIAGRFAFRQNSGITPCTNAKYKWQPHHLYVCYADSLALKNHLLFRNALRKDKDLVLKYADLKKSLTENPKITREEYTIQKTNFIVSVLSLAGLDKAELKQIRDANI